MISENYKNRIKLLAGILQEQSNNSIYIQHSIREGSIEGIIHYDIHKINNWLISRKIDPNKYKDKLISPVAFLNNINVYPRYRNKGYGNKLYSLFEQDCYDNDCKTILLEADTQESQNDGFDIIEWYKSLDFEIIGHSSNSPLMIKYI